MEEGDFFSIFSDEDDEDDTYVITTMEPPRKTTPVPYNPSLTILLEVFLFLKRNTIEKIQMVCRYWNDIILRNHSILPIYLFRSLNFYKEEHHIYMNLPYNNSFCLKKSHYKLIESTKNRFFTIDFSRIKSLKYGLFEYCDLGYGSKETLKALKQLYEIIGEKLNIGEKIKIDFTQSRGKSRLKIAFELLKDCNAYIKFNKISISIDPNYLKLFLEHPIMIKIRAKKIKISISYLRSWHSDYDSTFIKENTKKFIDLIQNNEIYGINRFSLKFDDSHDIINEAPDFCDNLMEIYMNAKDPTILPRCIELRRHYQFMHYGSRTDLSGNIPFLMLINEQNFKKQYDTGRWNEISDNRHFFKKIYEIKTKNEFVLRLGVEYANREYGNGVIGDWSEENIFKSAKMKLLLTE